jgi:hypothetical protein
LYVPSCIIHIHTYATSIFFSFFSIIFIIVSIISVISVVVSVWPGCWDYHQPLQSELYKHHQKLLNLTSAAAAALASAAGRTPEGSSQPERQSDVSA